MPTDDQSTTRLIAQHNGIALHADGGGNPLVTLAPRVLVVPVNYAGEVLFVRQEKTLTLPGGAIATGENPAQAAARVLQAVTGFKAEVTFALGTITPLAQMVQGELHLFLARNLVPARGMGDAIYQDAAERAPLDGITPLIASGRLRDASVIAALAIGVRFVAGKLHGDQASTDNG